MVFWLLFGGTSQIVDRARVAFGDLATAEGIIVEWEDTNTEINEETVERISLTYSIDGVDYDGDAELVESEAQKVAQKYKTGVGGIIPVEYVVGRPKLVHIVGTPWSAMTWWIVLILALFPAVGSLISISAFRKGRHASRLLKNGVLAWGTYTRKEKTSTEINEEPVCRYYFEFKDKSGKTYEIFHATHDPDDILDEEQEPLLYLSDSPSEGVVLDGLPGEPTLKDGGFTSDRPIASVKFLICPAIASFFILLSLLTAL